jgi:hypothetical protein
LLRIIEPSLVMKNSGEIKECLHYVRVCITKDGLELHEGFTVHFFGLQVATHLVYGHCNVGLALDSFVVIVAEYTLTIVENKPVKIFRGVQALISKERNGTVILPS